MEENLPEFENREELILADKAALNMRSAMVWAKFLAILGFVMTGMLFILSVLLLLNPAMFMSQDPDILSLTSLEYAMPGRRIMGISYLIMSVVMFFLYYFLFMGSVKIKRSIDFGNRQALLQGTGNLKYYFQMQGILAIIGICFFVLALIFAGTFIATIM